MPAGGLNEQEVAKQQTAIDCVNKRYGSDFHVFKGIESDILADGSFDYRATVDLVIASIHSKFRLSRKEQTDRIVKAVENPHTTILGHVTARQLMRRPGYEVDMERVLRACASHGVAIEINAHPWRLDMDWRWCERALAGPQVRRGRPPLQAPVPGSGGHMSNLYFGTARGELSVGRRRGSRGS